MKQDNPGASDARPAIALSGRLAAVASDQRMRIIALLAEERLHVSELARRIGMSRPLLYMHLAKLEEAGFVTGSLELGEDGKALKYFALTPFELVITTETIVAAVAADSTDGEE